MSQRPGMRNFPAPSTRTISRGMEIPRPMSAIKPALVTTVTAVSRAPLATSTTVTLVMAMEPAAHHEKAENRQDVQAPIGYRGIHRLSFVPAVGSSSHRVAGPSICWLSSRPNASGLEGATLKSARLFAGGDSVVRREVRARMRELRKTGIGGFPRRQKVLVPCRGRLDVASQLAGHRHAVQREARARPLDERLSVSSLCVGPIRSSHERRRLGFANGTNVGWRLAVSERFFFSCGLCIKFFRIARELLGHEQAAAQFQRQDR